MTNLIVEHTWKPQDRDSVLKVVSGIVDMAKNSKLPQGFSLKSVNAIFDENRAICNWEAPSKAAMEKLLSDVNPPTSHRVFESTKVY
ncbi:MAG: hypothetical protein QW364_05690 [Thermoplasmatales archaeon]